MTKNDDRIELLKQIKNEVVAFEKSPLYAERIRNGVYPVIGEGSHWAKIIFIGEAPGRNEAKTGRPFCGAAGKVLDELLASAGIDRGDVYITNIVKDRPPNNRDPLPEEIAAYAPFLDRQIEIIKPKIITALGRFSMAYILKKYGLWNDSMTIGKIHGQLFTAETAFGKIAVVPLYHPAMAVYNPATKELLKKDFKILERFK
ncbi:MAG: uracil-DNA glycosylase [Parcubacteria group bacterium]|nr:uracil-DNA glycosylase [Parcubacteria group bacterium]